MQVEGALNWLEQYFPDFNDMIYEIRQGQKANPPKLKKITISGGGENEYLSEQDLLNLTLEPSYYLGIDSKIYKESLEEVLVHELMHATQKTIAEDSSWALAVQAKAQIESINERSLRSYLRGERVPEDQIGNYIESAKNGAATDVGGLSYAIVTQPTYQAMAQNLFKLNKDYQEARWQYEDHAMDTENRLKQILGKSPRGHYYDTVVIGQQLHRLDTAIEIYSKESPAEIRARGHQTWEAYPGTPLPALVHGEQGATKGTLAEMQHDWNETHNADTKNISPDEWRVIEEVKGKLLPPEILAKISPAEKKKIDAVIETLKKEFNNTAGNDALSDDSKKLLTEKGLGDIVSKTSQTGWKL